MRPIGFSTGAVARGDFAGALQILRQAGIAVVELSALRFPELDPLASAIAGLDLASFQFVSLHAPSGFPPEAERVVVECLARIAATGIPVIVHPDTIRTPASWSALGEMLLLENMDKRKPVGRTVQELAPLFKRFPRARFCFDIAHARQVDPSMVEASALLRAFGDRLAQVHISEVNTASHHEPISKNAVRAFQRVARDIPERIPVILETLIDAGQSDIRTEMERARQSLDWLSTAAA